MYKKLLYTTFITTGIALAVSSCGKGYFELYENPNQVSTPSIKTLFPTVTHRTGLNTYNASTSISYYPQYLASPGASGSTDIYQEIDMTGTWDGIYKAIADTRDLRALAIESGASHYEGVASILLAYNLSLANNIWGGVPFDQASDANFIFPQYQDDKVIYDSCIALIENAITKLSSATTFPLDVNVDMIYGAVTGRTSAQTAALWLKAAYALKARLLIKTSKTSNFNAVKPDILDAVSKSFTSNAEDMGMAQFQLRNYWASVARSNASATLGGWLSEQFIDHLNGATYGIFDPRIEKLTDKTVNGIYIGTVNGEGNRPPGINTVWDECYVSVNSPVTSETAPIQLITYAELKFIEAEAALGLDNNRAYTAYLDGIRAHFNLLGVETADRDNYINEPTVSVGAANLTIHHIMKEKYVVMYLNPEAWVDARRYDYQWKDFTLPTNSWIPQFIRRQQYPRAEFAENGQNVPTVVLTDRLWWDQ